MYSKEETSRLKQLFWTTFGQYMAAIPSSEGYKVNWVNYKTGIKHLFFKMDADRKQASIAIRLNHPDIGMQALLFEQFVAFKNIFQNYLGDEWDWRLQQTDEYGKIESQIIKTLPGVNVLKQEDWPDIISFLKPSIISLDEFWNDAKDHFDIFRSA